VGFFGSQGLATVSSTDEAAWQGSRSVKVVTTGGARYGVLSAYIPLQGGKTYTWSCYVKGDPGQAIRLSPRDSSGQGLGDSREITLPDEGWHRILATSFFPYGETQTRFRIDSLGETTFY